MLEKPKMAEVEWRPKLPLGVDDVGGEDGGKATRSHPSGIPARRMPS